MNNRQIAGITKNFNYSNCSSCSVSFIVALSSTRTASKSCRIQSCPVFSTGLGIKVKGETKPVNWLWPDVKPHCLR